MAVIKRNIMNLFFIIFLLSTIVVLVLTHEIYKSVYKEYTKEQQNFTKISSTTINAVFSQYEATLNILGQLLTKNENYKSLNTSRKILDDILEINPSIVAFGLAKTNGQLYVTSSNLKNIKKLPNLAEKIETKKSFLHTLKKDEMTLGRTYYHKTLKSLIIPIRKAIKDKNNNVVAVMTAGINVNKAFDMLGKSNHSTIVLRALDNYYQLTDYRNSNKIYKMPLPKEFMLSLFKQGSKKYGINLEEATQKELIITLNYKHPNKKYSVLTTTQHLKRYELWIATQIDEKIIHKEILTKVLIMIAIYLVIMTTLFFLFYNLNKYEKNKKKALYYQANHDYLTKLHNRYFLSEHFEKIKKHKPFSLLYIDLDNFKNINDNYGHSYGDIILKELALRLQSFKNKDDILIRYSGDEFLLITYKTEKEKIKKLAEKIIKRVAEPYSVNHHKFILGASMGIAQYPLDADNFEEIKRYADIAMYEAKKTKNTYNIFEDNIKHKYLKTAKIEKELKTAIEHDEVYMVYQPQVNNDGSLHGVEALVRWENENLGFVPPNEFIKVAEDSGQMQKIGDFIIKKALKEVN